MAQLNAELNPTRMTPNVREKLHDAKINTGDGKTYEKYFGVHKHRIIAEQKIGRKMRKGEVVHHIDGNRRNNKPENLQVFSSQVEHATSHIRWDNLIQKYLKEVMPNEL